MGEFHRENLEESLKYGYRKIAIPTILHNPNGMCEAFEWYI